MLPGGLSLTENDVRFNAGFVGLEQVREVKLKSDFQVPVEVLSVHTTDARVQPVIKRNVIEPGKEQGVIDLHFDTGLSATSSMDKNEHLKGFQKTSWRLSELNIANFKTLISEALSSVSEHDVALWRSYLS